MDSVEGSCFAALRCHAGAFWRVLVGYGKPPVAERQRRAPPVTESLRFVAPAARKPTEGTLERGVARALVARHLRVRRDCNQLGRRGTCCVGREGAEWAFR